jgi:hypothetical protein
LEGKINLEVSCPKLELQYGGFTIPVFPGFEYLNRRGVKNGYEF